MNYRLTFLCGVFFIALFCVPASVAQSVSSKLSDKKIQLYKKEAAEFKSKAINVSGYLYDIVGEITRSEALNVLRVKDARERFFASSFTFVGCADSDRPVVGFYDLARHVWIVLWYDPANITIKHLRISNGFQPISLPEGTAWYHLFENENISVAEALTKAIEIQTEAFLALFSEDQCTVPMSDYDYFMDADAGLETLLISEAKIARIEKNTLKTIASKYLQDLPDDSELNFSLSSASLVEDGLFTIHAIRKKTEENPVFLMSQWRAKGDLLEAVTQGVWPQ